MDMTSLCTCDLQKNINIVLKTVTKYSKYDQNYHSENDEPYYRDASYPFLMCDKT